MKTDWIQLTNWLIYIVITSFIAVGGYFAQRYFKRWDKERKKKIKQQKKIRKEIFAGRDYPPRNVNEAVKIARSSGTQLSIYWLIMASCLIGSLTFYMMSNRTAQIPYPNGSQGIPTHSSNANSTLEAELASLATITAVAGGGVPSNANPTLEAELASLATITAVAGGGVPTKQTFFHYLPLVFKDLSN